MIVVPFIKRTNFCFHKELFQLKYCYQLPIFLLIMTTDALSIILELTLCLPFDREIT